jgi:hypothetical protein
MPSQDIRTDRVIRRVFGLVRNDRKTKEESFRKQEQDFRPETCDRNLKLT